MMRPSAIVRVVALSGGIIVSCRPYATPHRGDSGAGPTSGPTVDTAVDTLEQLRGTLFVTGSEPATNLTLRREDGTGVTLVGDPTDELRRLSGATVAVYGTRTSAARASVFAVRRYDVLSIDGQRPSVGILLVRDGAIWLAAADTVQLAAAPDALRTQAGAKVWIVGRQTDRGLEVQSYGVLRPAPE